jgi:hypothetical protein
MKSVAIRKSKDFRSQHIDFKIISDHFDDSGKVHEYCGLVPRNKAAMEMDVKIGSMNKQQEDALVSFQNTLNPQIG